MQDGLRKFFSIKGNRKNMPQNCDDHQHLQPGQRCILPDNHAAVTVTCRGPITIDGNTVGCDSIHVDYAATTGVPAGLTGATHQ